MLYLSNIEINLCLKKCGKVTGVPLIHNTLCSWYDLLEIKHRPRCSILYSALVLHSSLNALACTGKLAVHSIVLNALYAMLPFNSQEALCAVLTVNS
jgi:hypothetical protein